MAAMAAMAALLQTKLKLKVNAGKSAVARPWEQKFLGYSITWHQKQNSPSPRPAASASRPRREVFRTGRGQSRNKTIQQLREGG